VDLTEKLRILADSAKYDVACTSSGVNRKRENGIGSAVAGGICHSFAADGRCISLLKVLYSNVCVYDCKYCVNRLSNDIARASFTPSELAAITLEFYRRNYIEGLFLSSGVLGSPDNTMEQMIKALDILRNKFRFRGYIHAKAIPGASSELVRKLGLLTDRLSINIELPSEDSLSRLAPGKTRASILNPMGQITGLILQSQDEDKRFLSSPRFVPAGQATQMIIGATPETDLHIIKLSQGLYKSYGLRRVFYSAYIPVSSDSLLPTKDTRPPLLREHRLYQADWLMRQYGFTAEEILTDQSPNLNPYFDPKCHWALRHSEFFPVDVNQAPLEHLLRVPGIGPTSASRIVSARRDAKITREGLKKAGVVLKRARFFIITADELPDKLSSPELVIHSLADKFYAAYGTEQLSIFTNEPVLPGFFGNLNLNDMVQEPALCLV